MDSLSYSVARYMSGAKSPITCPIENPNGSVDGYTKNAKQWRGGKMILR